MKEEKAACGTQLRNQVYWGGTPGGARWYQSYTYTGRRFVARATHALGRAGENAAGAQGKEGAGKACGDERREPCQGWRRGGEEGPPQGGRRSGSACAARRPFVLAGPGYANL